MKLTDKILLSGHSDETPNFRTVADEIARLDYAGEKSTADALRAKLTPSETKPAKAKKK